MALPDLTGTYINDNYAGLIHTSNVPVLSTMVQLYDGTGNPVPIRISQDRVEISGITYPLSSTTTGYLFKDSSNVVTITNTISSSFIQPSTNAGTYNNIDSITVNAQGQITNINTNSVAISSIEEKVLTVTSTTYLETPVVVTATMVPTFRQTIGEVESYFSIARNITFTNIPNTTRSVVAFVRSLSSETSTPIAPYWVFAGRSDLTYDQFFPVVDQYILGDMVGVQFVSRVRMEGTNALMDIVDLGIVDGGKPNYNVEVTLLGYQD